MNSSFDQFINSRSYTVIAGALLVLFMASVYRKALKKDQKSNSKIDRALWLAGYMFPVFIGVVITISFLNAFEVLSIRTNGGKSFIELFPTIGIIFGVLLVCLIFMLVKLARNRNGLVKQIQASDRRGKQLSQKFSKIKGAKLHLLVASGLFAVSWLGYKIWQLTTGKITDQQLENEGYWGIWPIIVFFIIIFAIATSSENEDPDEK